jgi:predicted phage terminase large subunit-like protein|nr:MAG TPA: Large Terminase [Caudoviricetes sp.]
MNLLDEIVNKLEVDKEYQKNVNQNSDNEDNKYLKIKEECRYDFEKFCRTFLGEQFSSTWSTFHYDLVKALEDIIFNHKDEETKNVRAAPRGHAKSTFVSFAFPLWCICYGYKQTIIVISCSADMARLFLTRIREELEFNELIIKVFGKLQGSSKWNNSEILTSTGVYCVGKGAGQQMRGLNFKSRPDLVIIDDLESEESVATETQRATLDKWFSSAVMKMGSPNCDFFFIGTVLSYDSLLYKLLTLPTYSMWQRKIYRAVIKFSESTLWLKWEEKMTNLSDPDPYNTAKKFYLKHKKEMLKGTKVLWESQRENMYLHLMETRLQDEEAFNSEFQNDPQTEKSRIFKEEWLEENTYEYPPNIKRVYGAVDPSCGKNRKADTSAIVILGEGEDNYIYVLEASIKVRRVEDIILDMEKIIGKYYNLLEGFVVETNQFQALFSTTVQQHFIDLGMYVNWIEIFHGANDKKERRINSMIPKIKNGYLKFNKSHVMLWRQMKNYPKDRDDGVDCLEMALRPLLQSRNNTLCFSSLNTNVSTMSERRSDKVVREIKKNFGIGY